MCIYSVSEPDSSLGTSVTTAPHVVLLGPLSAVDAHWLARPSCRRRPSAWCAVSHGAGPCCRCDPLAASLRPDYPFSGSSVDLMDLEGQLTLYHPPLEPLMNGTICYVLAGGWNLRGSFNSLTPVCLMLPIK